MAAEAKRGCGYRKVGGVYLVGNYISIPCDRLPLPLHSCPVCGGGIHFSRSLIEINPQKLIGMHEDCDDRFRPCFLCDPKDEIAFIMMVGEKYYPTPEHFMQEGRLQGISKRIPFIPRKLELGKTIFYLAHNKACIVKELVAVQQAMSILEESQSMSPKLLEDENKHHLGIFTAFIPQRIEKICWQSEYTPENIEKHQKKGIDLVSVPDGDIDHK